MNLTKKQIKLIIRYTKKGLKGTEKSIAIQLGCYQQSNANWGYVAGWTDSGDLIVTVFGEVQ